MSIKQKVQDWFDGNPAALEQSLRAFQDGGRAGAVRYRLVTQHQFPYSRDDLEIWRRATNTLSPRPMDFRSVMGIRVGSPDQGTAVATSPRMLLDAPPPPLGPARIDGPKLLPTTAPADHGDYKLIAIFPDQQAPHHDPQLHELSCRWLDQNKPDGLVYLGDAIDLPSLSHYRRNPYMVGGDRAAALQLGLDTTYGLFRDNMQAAGETCTYRKYLPGNHEQRLMNYLLDNAEALFGVRRAGGGEPVVTLEYLLRLDELGVDFVRHPNGEWPNASLALTDNLAARHGWLVRQNSAATAHATLRHLGHSVIVGHTHRKGTAFWTQTEISGLTRVHVGVEAGTMALPELGYAPAPDWQQGFVVVRIFPDNQQFSITHANYVNNTLIWEGQRYSESARGIAVAA